MIHLYTGDGKGKTTAAIGLAIRAVGAGLRVIFIQFLKDGVSSELPVLERIPKIVIKVFGRPGLFDTPLQEISSELKQLLLEGWDVAKGVLKGNFYNVVILDEFTYMSKLFPEKITEFSEVISKAGKKKEVVITGRDPHPYFYEIADLISYIEKRKHYCDKGIKAGKGIEY